MRPFSIAVVVLLALSAPAAFGVTRLEASRRSVVVLEGSSNVTDWRCTGNRVNAQVEIAAPIQQINEVIDRIEDGNIAAFMTNPAAARFPQPSVDLQIPVVSLRCGNRMMERDMNNALKADRNPDIRFRFTGTRSAIRHDMDRSVYEADVAGELWVAGVKRSVVLTVEAQRITRDTFRLHAVLPAKMTDFDVTPPTALFGMVKARNELLVRFDLILKVVNTVTGAGHGLVAGRQERSR